MSETTITEKLPASASKGANNGLYIQCERMGFRRKYFVCLHTIDSYERGEAKPQSQVEDCGRAVDCGQCEAKKMHKEELAAGEAIHFKQDGYHAQVSAGKTGANQPPKKWSYDTARKIVGVEASKSPVRDIRRHTGGVGSLKTTKPTGQPITRAEKPTYDMMDMAKLVTDMAKNEHEEGKVALQKMTKVAVEEERPIVTAQQTKSAPSKRLEGESLIDMAKRLNKERQA